MRDLTHIVKQFCKEKKITFRHRMVAGTEYALQNRVTPIVREERIIVNHVRRELSR